MLKNKFFLIACTFALGFVGLGIWFTLQPARGTVRVAVKEPDKDVINTASLVQTFSGHKISFSYPGSFYIQPNSASTSGFIDRVVLLGEGIRSKKITIATSATAISSLSDVPAVQSRRLNPDVYLETPLTLAGSSGLLFTKTTMGLELTGLVIRDGFLSTLSLTSNSTGEISNQELTAEFQSLIDSWSWK